VGVAVGFGVAVGGAATGVAVSGTAVDAAAAIVAAGTAVSAGKTVAGCAGTLAHPVRILKTVMAIRLRKPNLPKTKTTRRAA
jgi:hypothetical protein